MSCKLWDSFFKCLFIRHVFILKNHKIHPTAGSELHWCTNSHASRRGWQTCNAPLWPLRSHKPHEGLTLDRTSLVCASHLWKPIFVNDNWGLQDSPFRTFTELPSMSCLFLLANIPYHPHRFFGLQCFHLQFQITDKPIKSIFSTLNHFEGHDSYTLPCWELIRTIAQSSWLTTFSRL